MSTQTVKQLFAEGRTLQSGGLMNAPLLICIILPGAQAQPDLPLFPCVSVTALLPHDVQFPGPDSFLYVLNGQGGHDVAPNFDEKLPGGHAAHTELPMVSL